MVQDSCRPMARDGSRTTIRTVVISVIFSQFGSYMYMYVEPSDISLIVTIWTDIVDKYKI